MAPGRPGWSPRARLWSRRPATVAPSRERGLKRAGGRRGAGSGVSLPHGCADRNAYVVRVAVGEASGSVGCSRPSGQKNIGKDEALWIEAVGSDGTEAFEGLVNFVPEVIAGERDRGRDRIHRKTRVSAGLSGHFGAVH